MGLIAEVGRKLHLKIWNPASGFQSGLAHFKPMLKLRFTSRSPIHKVPLVPIKSLCRCAPL